MEYHINVKYKNKETGEDIPQTDIITVTADNIVEAVALAQGHLDRLPLYPRYLAEGRIEE